MYLKKNIENFFFLGILLEQIKGKKIPKQYLDKLKSLHLILSTDVSEISNSFPAFIVTRPTKF